MLASLTLRTKIIALIGLAVLALALVMALAFAGLNRQSAMLDEIGKNRLPSVQSLQIINEGQTALRSATRAIDALSADPQQGDAMRREIERKQQIWARIDKPWQIDDPLPQTAEEEKVWNQFVREWALWKQFDTTLTELSGQLSRADAAPRRKQLSGALLRALQDSCDSFSAAEASLAKLVELNIGYGAVAVQEADRASAAARHRMARVPGWRSVAPAASPAG